MNSSRSIIWSLVKKKSKQHYYGIICPRFHLCHFRVFFYLRRTRSNCCVVDLDFHISHLVFLILNCELRSISKKKRISSTLVELEICSSSSNKQKQKENLMLCDRQQLSVDWREKMCQHWKWLRHERLTKGQTSSLLIDRSCALQTKTHQLLIKSTKIFVYARFFLSRYRFSRANQLILSAHILIFIRWRANDEKLLEGLCLFFEMRQSTVDVVIESFCLIDWRTLLWIIDSLDTVDLWTKHFSQWDEDKLYSAKIIEF